MKNKFYVALFFLLLTTEIFSSGGSLYSRYGIGDFFYSFSARRMGFGELGISASDYDYLNPMNPASWSKIRLTRFETGVIFNSTGLSSNTSSAFHSQTIFTGMLLGFPIDKERGISFVAGFVPYSNVNYEVVSEGVDPVVSKIKTSNAGEGGISKALVGVSYKLPFDFSIGASFDYYNGKITYSTNIEFTDTTADLFDAKFSREYSHHGVGYTIGLISSDLAELIGTEKIREIQLGFFYSASPAINTDTLNTSSSLYGAITTSSGTVKTNIPYRLGVGLSAKIDNRYLLMADYIRQPFGNFSIDGVRSETLRDMQKVSLGFEYRNPEFRSQSFWEQVSFRFGLSYEQSQYEISGKGINQYSIYTGLSIPLGFDNTLDFGFQYSRRGTKENNLLDENIYKFSITLSVGELWFIRTER